MRQLALGTLLALALAVGSTACAPDINVPDTLVVKHITGYQARIADCITQSAYCVNLDSLALFCIGVQRYVDTGFEVQRIGVAPNAHQTPTVYVLLTRSAGMSGRRTVMLRNSYCLYDCTDDGPGKAPSSVLSH